MNRSRPLWTAALVLGACAVAWLAVRTLERRPGADEPLATEVAARERAQAPDEADAERGGARAPAPTPASEAAVEPPGDEPVRGEAGHLTGVVLDAQGAPLGGARVRVRPGTPSWGFAVPAASPHEPEGRTGGRTGGHTGADGRFRVAVGPGAWELEVAADGYGLWRADHLRAGDHREVRLEPALRLTVWVRGDDGRPLPDVEVALLDSFRAIDSRPLAASTSDGTGRAVLEGLPPGERYLRARRPGYQYKVEILDLSPARRWHEHELRLARGVRLAGTVVGAADGAPLAGARVRVEAFARGQSVVATLATDAAGRFATEARYAPGEPVTVRAAAEGFAEATRGLLLDPDEPAGEGADRRTVELRLARGGRTLAGRAVDADGRGVAGAVVRLRPTPPAGRGRDGVTAALMQVTPHPERWREVARTDAGGRFEVAGLSGELDLVLLLAAEAFAPRVEWVADASEERTDLGDLLLHAAGSLWGTARFDDDGAPVVGERVRAQLEIILSEGEYESEFDGWRPTRWWRPLTAETGADGAFRIDGVAPGTYDLRLGTLDVGARSVRAGEAVGPIELRVPRAAFADDEELGVVSGVVTDAEGAPLRGRWVALVDGDAEDGAPVSMTTSDLDGRFRLRAAPRDDYVLRVVSLLGEHAEHRAPLGRWREPFEVDVVLEAVAAPSEPLIGRVLDPTGLPLEGIAVSIEPPENEHCGCLAFEAHTDADGVVTFERLREVEHRVVARDPQGRYRSVERFPVGPGGYFELVLAD